MPMFSRDPHARDLSAWEAEPVTIGYRIARLVARAMRDAKDDDGLSRAQLAEKMSAILDRPVREATLDKWASEAAEEHRIPLDAFVALIEATGQHKLLGFLPTLFGFAVVPVRFVDMIELQQLQEHREAVAAREAVLRAKIKGGRS